ADQALDFGLLRMGHGVAYMLNSETTDIVGLQKTWLDIDGQQYLVESVPYVAAAPLLEKLQASAGRAGKTEFAGRSFSSRKQLTAALSRLSPAGKSTAKIEPGKARKEMALLLDYQTLNTSQTNYVFKGDSTYYLSANVALYGSNTLFEAGSVIKSA